MRRAVTMLALFAALAITTGACGGGGDADTTEQTETTADLATAPEPQESISDATTELNEALANEDCDQYFGLAHFLTRSTPEPDAPATDEECEAARPFFDTFAEMEFTESEEFGTAAISQGPAPEGISEAPDEVAAMTWILQADGTWGHQQNVFLGDPQIGTEPAGDPMPTAEAFVDAMRDGDCEAMRPLLLEDGPLGQAANGDLDEACRLLTEGQILAPALEETPDPELTDLGGTLDHTFVGLATRDDYFTISLSTPSVDPDQEEQETEMLIADVRSNTVDAEELAALEEQPADSGEGEQGAEDEAAPEPQEE